VNATAYFDQLGKEWEIKKNTFKPFACGIVMHPTIDGAIQLRDEMGQKGLSNDDIKSIDLRVNPEVLILTGKTIPQTGLEGKFSIFHATAIGLLYGEASPSQFTDEVVRNSTVVDLRRKVNVTEDASVSRAAAVVTVAFNDGTTLKKTVEDAKGSLDNPLTDSELEKKFMEQVTLAIGEERAMRAYGAFSRIGGMENVARIRGMF
jgi:2-methylcitrate dehydratase PrpD